MCKEEGAYKFTILFIQEGLFTSLNPNIITTISEDGHTLTASNISEADVNNIYLVTNNPKIMLS